MPTVEEIYEATNMTVKDIQERTVIKYLKDNEYEGLFLDDGGECCGCGLDDFAPCDEMDGECEAAYRQPNGGWSPDKPEVKNGCLGRIS